MSWEKMLTGPVPIFEPAIRCSSSLAPVAVKPKAASTRSPRGRGGCALCAVLLAVPPYSASRLAASSASSTINRVASSTSSARPSGDGIRPSVRPERDWRGHLDTDHLCDMGSQLLAPAATRADLWVPNKDVPPHPPGSPGLLPTTFHTHLNGGPPLPQ